MQNRKRPAPEDPRNRRLDSADEDGVGSIVVEAAAREPNGRAGRSAAGTDAGHRLRLGRRGQPQAQPQKEEQSREGDPVSGNTSERERGRSVPPKFVMGRDLVPRSKEKINGRAQCTLRRSGMSTPAAHFARGMREYASALISYGIRLRIVSPV